MSLICETDISGLFSLNGINWLGCSDEESIGDVGDLGRMSLDSSTGFTGDSGDVTGDAGFSRE